MERRKNMDARDVALYGLLIALAFVLSYEMCIRDSRTAACTGIDEQR